MNKAKSKTEQSWRL